MANPGAGMPSCGRRRPRPDATSPGRPPSASENEASASSVGRCGLAAYGGGDLVEEAGADDAAAAPDRRDRAEVDRPAVLGGAGLDLVEALGVGDDLRGVERLLDVVGEALAAAPSSAAPGSPGRPAGGVAQLAVAGQRAREDGLGDAGDRDAEVERGLHRPAAGALLLGLVGDDVDERLAGVGVDVREHLGGDLDQVGVEARPAFQLAEDVGDLGRVRAQARCAAGRRPRR